MKNPRADVAGGLRTAEGVKVPLNGEIVYGAAQIAALVLEKGRGKGDSFWFVAMDADRRRRGAFMLCEGPTPVNRGRVSHGLLMKAKNAAAREADAAGLGCWALVHRRAGSPGEPNRADVTTAEWIVNGNAVRCFAPDGNEWATDPFGLCFFVDFVETWADGTFRSFREDGMIDMDGGDRP